MINGLNWVNIFLNKYDGYHDMLWKVLIKSWANIVNQTGLKEWKVVLIANVGLEIENILKKIPWVLSPVILWYYEGDQMDLNKKIPDSPQLVDTNPIDILQHSPIDVARRIKELLELSDFSIPEDLEGYSYELGDFMKDEVTWEVIRTIKFFCQGNDATIYDLPNYKWRVIKTRYVAELLIDKNGNLIRNRIDDWSWSIIREYCTEESLLGDVKMVPVDANEILLCGMDFKFPLSKFKKTDTPTV